MDELLEQFLIEGRELVEQASTDLLALEREPSRPDLIDSAFRAFHTLKGSTALFDLAPMGQMLHAAEDLLGAVRAGEAALDDEAAEALLAVVRQTERWLDRLEASGDLPPDAPGRGEALTARLRGANAAPAPSPSSDEAAPAWAEALLDGLAQAAGPLVAVRYTPARDAFFRGDDPIAILRAAPGLVRLTVAPREPWASLADYDPFGANLVFVGLFDAPVGEVRSAFRFVADEVQLTELTPRAAPGTDRPDPDTAPEQASAATGGLVRTLRVDAEKVDHLGAAVDDLVVAKNTLAHLVGRAAEAGASSAWLRGLVAAQTDLERLVARLHGSVNRIRLTPLSPLFRRFSRLAREIGAGLGKDVELRLRGEEVEVDKSVVDGLFDPLLHLLRNAVDHGVETAEERRAAGKPGRAVLGLSARPAGDQVIIELSDDGRGIDPARIRRVAIERGLLPAEAAAALSDAEAIDLIFAPGFSTAASVSQVSGRGVGMDAVRTAVAALGGRVSVESRVGRGSTVRMALPLSVVLTRIMVVEAGGERYGVPLDAIVETTRVPAAQLAPIRAGRAFVLRDEPIPVLSLCDLLALPAAPPARDLKVLVVQAGPERIGVAVDAFGERIDAPLRATTGLLNGLPGVVGATLQGDGSVLMVLDLPELIG